MKNRFLLVLLMIFSLILTGCSLHKETSIVIDKDENVKLSSLIALDNDFIDMMLEGEGEKPANEGKSESTENIDEAKSTEDEDDRESRKIYSNEQRWAYLESHMTGEGYEGYTQTKYEEGEFKGYFFEKELGKLDDLTLEGEEVIIPIIVKEDSTLLKPLNDLIIQEKLFSKRGNVYSFHMKVTDAEENADEISDEEDEDFLINLSITLPDKAKSNNASRVSKDGLTYTWNLLSVKTVELSFQKSQSFLLPCILILVIIVVAALVIVIKKDKKEEI